MTTNIDPAGLRALVKLVGQSVETIIAEYEKKNSVPLSLDDLRPGPFDATEDQTIPLSEAVRALVGACTQLSFTCATPGYTIVNVRHVRPLTLTYTDDLHRKPWPYVRSCRFDVPSY